MIDMILNNISFEIGKIIITDNKALINHKEINTKRIDIISKDNKIRFVLHTLVPHYYFNELELNKTIDIMDKIDNHDICVYVDKNSYINSPEDSEVYFTKLEDNKFKLNVIIKEFEELFVDFKSTIIPQTLELETIINFN